MTKFNAWNVIKNGLNGQSYWTRQWRDPEPKKNYDVIGVMRRSSSFNTARIDHLYKLYPNKFDTSYGDLSDLNSIERNLEKFEPDEIYNLAAQSHVKVSFDIPEYTKTDILIFNQYEEGGRKRYLGRKSIVCVMQHKHPNSFCAIRRSN